MADHTIRCYECRAPLDPRGDNPTVELNPDGGDSIGYHRSNLCDECAEVLAEKMEPTTGGNV